MLFKNRFICKLILNYTLFIIFIFISALAIIVFYPLLFSSEKVTNYSDGINILYDDIKDELYISKPLKEGDCVEILDGIEVVKSTCKNKIKRVYTPEILNSILKNPVNQDTLQRTTISYIQGKTKKIFTILYKEKVDTSSLELSFTTGDKLNLDYSISNYTFIIIMIIVIFLPIIITFSFLLSHAVGRPLEILNRGLEKAVEGDYHHRIDFKSNYELERVKNAFNNLLEKLNKSTEENKIIAESKKKLMLDMSHDLRTPITSIKGCAQIISDRSGNKIEDIRRCAEIINEKAEYLKNCIENMFTFAKLDTDVYKLNKNIIDLAEFLRNVLIRNYTEFVSRGFLMVIEIPDEVIKATIDELEMERAITNLLMNSLKYNDSGTTFYLKMKEYEGKIELTLGDDGKGIPEAIKETVFNEFVHGRHEKSGTGLGLPITKKIIELHGGRIALILSKKGGTMFQITLPRFI